MSTMNELAVVRDELLRCSRALIDLSETLQDWAHTWDEPEEAATETVTEQEEVQLSLADVRACLAQKSVEGHTAAIQALIRKYNAEKLSQVDPKHYAALIAEAEVL